MLNIQDLCVTVEDKTIINNLNLKILPGETHAIMGPNGTGKSTLAHVLSGKKSYNITQGDIVLNGEDLISMSIEERSHKGLFLSFQYPLEIPGVTTINFLKTIVNAKRRAQQLPELPPLEMLQLINEKAEKLNISDKLLKRALNVGFSGGEKKRLEILQMMLLEPSFVILDEADSGLDIDALRMVADAINMARTRENCWLIITHYARLLKYLEPNFVHIFDKGKIVKTGNYELALALEEHGYENFINDFDKV